MRSQMKKHEISHMVSFWDSFLQEMKDMKFIKFFFCLNDNGDILVRIKPESKYVKKRKTELQDLAAFDGDQ